MAEDFERYKQFDYQLNSNLVIQRDNHASLSANEPTGEPESLAGRLRHAMGDRAVKTTPAAIIDRLAQKRAHAEEGGAAAPEKRLRPTGELASRSVLEARIPDAADGAAAAFAPAAAAASAAARAARDHLLGEVAALLPDQPAAVVQDAAAEVLFACQNRELPVQDRQQLVARTLAAALGGRPAAVAAAVNARWARLEALAERMAGGGDGGAGNAAPGADEDAGDEGVAVVFDDEADLAGVVADQDRGGPLLVDLMTGMAGEVVGNMEVEGVAEAAEGGAEGTGGETGVAPAGETAAFTRGVRVVAADDELGSLPPSEAASGAAGGEEGGEGPQPLRFLPQPAAAAADAAAGAAGAAAAAAGAAAAGAAALAGTDGAAGASAAGAAAAPGFTPQNYYDVESMAFREGSRFMSNDVVRLPEESQRRETKAYDEVVVPPAAKPAVGARDLLPISSLPAWAQPAFAGISSLNVIQSRVFDTAFRHTERNMLVCAPTGAGKTNIALLAMLAAMREAAAAAAGGSAAGGSAADGSAAGGDAAGRPAAGGALSLEGFGTLGLAAGGERGPDAGAAGGGRDRMEDGNGDEDGKEMRDGEGGGDAEGGEAARGPRGAATPAARGQAAGDQAAGDQAAGVQAASADYSSTKIVYISPMKALVAEQVLAFQKRLAPYSLSVRELTGDANLSRAQLEAANVIVATPEKWDVVSRRAGVERLRVQLIILDEVHLLHDSRGPVLEAIVARTLRQAESTQEYVRLVALSATLPNYLDVAIFLRVPLGDTAAAGGGAEGAGDAEGGAEGGARGDAVDGADGNGSLRAAATSGAGGSAGSGSGVFVFGPEFRPVPLLQTFIGLKEKKAVKRLATMNDVLYEKVLSEIGRGQILVFVHSRRETVRTARFLRQRAMDEEKLAAFVELEGASREVLIAEAENARTPALRDLVPYGIAVHHAGLPRDERRLVEDLFADRHLQVLVSTATLAWGVNLPAHTVIIKGTTVYLPDQGGWTELSALDLMQMLGRAGRPQYDTSGHGIIITQHSELQFYLSLTNQQLPVESQLFAMLPDILNAEIVLGTIRSRADAVDWLGYTHLFVRLLRAPAVYGLPADVAADDPALEQVRTDLAHSALRVLDRHQLCRYDAASGLVHGTALGRVASAYYLRYASVAVYNEHLRPHAGDIDLLRVFSLSREFRALTVREEEKAELAKLLEKVPVPVRGSGPGTLGVEAAATKVNVLLQAYIARLSLEGFALAADVVYIHQSAVRIFRALFEIALRRGWAETAERSLELAKMVACRMFSSMSPLRQFRDVLPEDVVRRLERRDFPWARYLDLSSSELGELVKQSKLGKLLHKLVHAIPRVELSALLQPFTRSTIFIDVTITPDFRWDSRFHTASGEMFWLLIEDGDGEHVLHYEPFLLFQDQVASEEPFELTISCSVPVTEPVPQQYFLKCISDRWLKSETALPLLFRDLVLPAKNPPPTEVLDLVPLPLSALEFPELEKMLATDRPSLEFDAVTTQVFDAVWRLDESVVVTAPPSPSGLRTLAELAIAREYARNANARCVCLLPKAGLVRWRSSEWRARFKPLGILVAELTGDVATDFALLANNHVVVCTPQQWDMCTRRWKTRKIFGQIRLFIAEGLEHLTTEPTLEICVARMRYISAQMEDPIRVLGLAASLANTVAVGEWLGARRNAFFFSSDARSSPLEVVIQGFDAVQRTARIAAMSREVFRAISSHGSSDRVLIYCPDRKQARLMAVDLLLYAAAEDDPGRFAGRSEEEMEAAVAACGFQEQALCDALVSGVGYLHEGMSEAVRRDLVGLFESGAVRVLLLTERVIWDVHATAGLVIVMETTRFDARVGQFVDYSLVDLVRMLSRASQSTSEAAGAPGGGAAVVRPSVAVVLCPASKRAFLRKFLTEPFPVESCLDQDLAQHLNTEVTLRTVESKQEAIDWLTWTFYYRRLSKNPNYYGLAKVSNIALSEHLSEAVETAVASLENAQCLVTDPDDGMTLTDLNLGMIAAFYQVHYSAVDLMSRSVSSDTRRRGFLEVLCAGPDLAQTLEMRQGEEKVLAAIARESGLRLTPGATDFMDPHVKALVLLHAYMERVPLTADLSLDLSDLVPRALQLAHALVDVISSSAWSGAAVRAMELSQQLVQAVAPGASPLAQLPHFSAARVRRAAAAGIADVLELAAAEDDIRGGVLAGLTETQVEDVAAACNRYPVLEVSVKGGAGGGDSAEGGAGGGGAEGGGGDAPGAKVGASGAEGGARDAARDASRDAARDASQDAVRDASRDAARDASRDTSRGASRSASGVAAGSAAGSAVLRFPASSPASLTLSIERIADLEDLGPVIAPRFPQKRALAELWWVVLSDPAADSVLAVKRVTAVGAALASEVTLQFDAPEKPGRYDLAITVMSGCYVGADQEVPCPILVEAEPGGHKGS